MKEKHINIDNLINLGAFETTEDEKEKLEKEIEDFLEYAKVINNCPCGDLKPSSHSVEKEITFREDADRVWEKLESMLANGPHTESTNYIVPPQKGRSGKEKEVDDSQSIKVPGDDYEAVIGLEIHAQLRTKSKLFCSCSTVFGREPNNNTCPVCSGQPGVLPVLNREAVNMAIIAGHATNCSINKRSVFARKNYFYPDLPKGYQISQFEEPICKNGSIEIETKTGIKKIRLNRIHMEEDAGKMVHIGAPGIWGSKASAVDYNRSCVPLIEIVTEPDITSGDDAKEFVIILRSILVSLGLCDGNMDEGSLRCDANISIRPRGDKKLGTKTEVKNMNSFKAIERAINFEIERQKKMKKLGLTIDQETRLWDESSQKTYLMRSKEESHDYRYFPEPDLLPLVLEDSLIESLKSKVGMLPLQRKNLYIEKYSFTEDEARLFMINPDYADFFENCLKTYNSPRTIANWFFNEILFYVSSDFNIHISCEDFAEFIQKIDKEEISGKIGKAVIKKAFEAKKSLASIIDEEGLRQITDHKTIEEIIKKVLDANPKEVEFYKNGKTNLFGYFVGLVMKETRGNANPKLVNEILKLKLDEI